MVFDKSDGAFWISLADLMQSFGRVVVGKVGFQYEYRFRCLMNRSDDVGCIPAYSYSLKVDVPCEVVFGIHQEDDRVEGVAEYRRYLDLGIVLLKRENGRYCYYDAVSKLRTDRDHHLECLLQPGLYVAVPISGGCSLQRPSDASRLSLALLTETDDLDPLFQSTIKDIFRRFDHDLSQSIGANEFAELSGILGRTIDPSHFHNVICNKYTSHAGGVSLQGLYEMFMTAIHDHNTEDTVREWLRTLGYDRDLYSLYQRALVFTAHSMYPVEVIKQTMDPELYTLAWGLAAEHRGKVEQDTRGIQLSSYKGASGVAFIAKNSASSRKKFNLNMRESQNVDFSICSGTKESWINPGEHCIMQHIQCMRNERRYNYTMSMTVSG